MRSDGGRRGRGRTSAWTLFFWRTQAGEAKGKESRLQTLDSSGLCNRKGRQVSRQQGTFRLATNDRPFPYLAYSQKEKKRKVKKREKGGKNSARMWYLFSRFWAWNPKP
ncbi:unnamed protein product [Sphagnum troendelagicum]|uniref:Secreted protein n=1 Tax=Sphagnum troendelagicum TaxID=128251 RepID=A0ABP0T9B1_9BRYO